MSDNVVLQVGGEIFEGWEKVSVKKTIKNLCGSFSLDYTDRWSASKARRPIFAQEKVLLYIGGDLVITGYIDSTSGSKDEGSESLSVSGRDITCDLVDCSKFLAPGNFSGSVNFLEMAKKLCAPFGIKVLVDTTAKLVTNKPWSITHGEKVSEVLEKAAKLLGVFLITDNRGNLVISSASKTINPAGLSLPGNILAASASLDYKDRYSDLSVLSQGTNAFDESSAETSQQIKSTVKDPSVKRHRTIDVVVEGANTTTLAKKRAEWEVRTRAANSARTSVSLAGWRDSRNKLWTTNQLISTVIPFLGVNDELLISELEFSFSNSEDPITTLTLERKDAYLPEPVLPTKDPTFNFGEASNED